MSHAKTWRCSVCGYIHEGDVPPENCPVCGVPASEFEEIIPQHDTPAPERPAGDKKSWRCVVCGYIHEGDTPPDECPVCGAPASDFEEIAPAHPLKATASGEAEQIVVIGGGIAGLSAAEAAREAAPEARITLLTSEEELPYYRLNLTRYLAGEIPDDELLIHPPEWYEEKHIDIQPGKALREILPTEKRIELTDGLRVDYEKLIVATGARPFLPPIPGSDQAHVHTLRTADDAKAILAMVKPGAQIICIGGGILGLETAGALARQGANVTVLEAFDHLMPRQLNAEGSDVLAKHLYSLGIDVITHAKVNKIESKTVELADGSVLPGDLVVVTVGVRSNADMLKEAGLPVHLGVLVDNFMRTSDPDILAAGDVCEHDGVMYGSWAAAQYQGKIAGMNAAGVPTEFGGIPRAHNLKVLGKDMFSIGEIRIGDGSFIGMDEHVDGNYRMFLLHDDVMVGALLIGDLSLMSACRSAIEGGRRIASATCISEVVEALTSG